MADVHSPFKPTAARPPRQPARARTSALILIVFMLIVWFVAPSQLPLFFQRLVGLVNAILAMLVAVFAIREYGKKYNRLRWPMLGRVSTSRVIGGLMFAGVTAWWLSPFAPIQPGQVEPDLWRVLEQDLDDPMLLLADRDLAVIAPPFPSAAARETAAAVSEDSSQLTKVLAAIASGRFDDADALLNGLAQPASRRGVSPEQLLECRAMCDLVAGRFGSATRRYAELLKSEPRRENYLAHGALAAALDGDFSTAAERARQLLDQASTRGQKTARYGPAINLLAIINVSQGRNADARRLLAQTTTLGQRTGQERIVAASAESYLAAEANNQAVLRILTGPATSPGLSDGFVAAKKLRVAWNVARGRPRDFPDRVAAVAVFNLGMLALAAERFDQAEDLLGDALKSQRQVAGAGGERVKSASIGVNLNALAEVARWQADYARAEALSDEADTALPPSGGARIAWLLTRAALDADRGRLEQSAARYRAASELSTRLLPNHPLAAIARMRLGEMEIEAGRLDEGASLIKAALDELEASGIDRPSARADAHTRLGTIAVKKGDREDARRQFDEAGKLLGVTRGDSDGERQDDSTHIETLAVAALRAARAQLADSPDGYAAAASDCQAAIAIVERTFGSRAANHPLLADYLYDLGMIDVRRERLLAAEPLLRQALAIREKVVPENKPPLIAVLNALAGVLEKSGRGDEARRFAARVKELHER